MTPQVRTATEQDAAEISRLCAHLGYPVDDLAMRDRLGHLLKSPLHTVIVAHDGRAMLGWISGEVRTTLESGTRVEITGLVVDTCVRRSGVGRLLVAGVESWAVDLCCREVAVRSNISRTDSHPFYESLGYIRAKTQHSYKKDVMTSNISLELP